VLADAASQRDPVGSGAEAAPRASALVWLAPPTRVRQPPISGMRLAGLGLLATMLVALVALASTPSTYAPGTVGASPTGAGGIVYTLILLALIADLVVLGLVLYVLRPRRPRKRSDEDEGHVYQPPPAHWAVKLLAVAFPLVILAGLILAVFAAHVPGTGLQSHPRPAAPKVLVTPQPTPHPGLSEGGPSQPPVFTLTELLAAAILTLLAVAIVVWKVRTRYTLQYDEPGRAQALAAIVDDSLEHVRREREPRRAVIVAYATMERLLAAYGFPRRAFEAPLEYLARVFQSQHVDAHALRTLTELFELAKFSHHDISLRMKEQAVSALTTIRDSVRENV
jgi:Domain of unknown function (DUF4129)